jgi:hypothetical protein
MRLDSLTGEKKTGCFDAENLDIGGRQRDASIRSVMEDHAIPFLMECRSLEGIRRLFAKGVLKNAFVHYQVDGFLDSH